MAIPKDNPVELEARLIEAGQMLRQASKALDELSQLANHSEVRGNLRLVAGSCAATADRVLS